MGDAPPIGGGAGIGLVDMDGRMVATDLGEAQYVGFADLARVFGLFADLDMRLDRHLMLQCGRISRARPPGRPASSCRRWCGSRASAQAPAAASPLAWPPRR